MADPIGQTPTIRMLEQSLNLLAQRHRVLLANIANEETPGYQARDLDFRATLAAATGLSAGSVALTPGVQAPHRRHLSVLGSARPTPTPTVIPVPSSQAGLDGNTVGIEKTMAALHENSTLFSAASQILSRKYQGLLSAIRETR